MNPVTVCARRLLGGAALVAAALAVVSAARARGQPGRAPLRALFIGNSYMYFNDLPSVVGDLAKAAGERPFVAEEVLVGGSTLERHLAQGDALKAIARRKWDVVIVQEQSVRPIDDPAAMLRDMQTVAEAVKAAGARLVLYETWAREAAPGMQDSLSHVYHRAARLTGGKPAHVGEAWAAFRSEEKVKAGAHSALFRNDGSHPSGAGTYLAASVLYATLYGRTPVGLPPVTRRTGAQPPPGPPANAPHDTLPATLARRLQELAWKAARQ
ncbi:MAG: hypothetical protein ACHQQ3_03740 [Gemmatimonadales bacterium]